MGNFFSSKKPHSIVCCGLDNAGKSTIINQLKPQKKRRDDIVPTPGFQVEEFEKGSVSFKVFDMGGARKYRELWATVFSEVGGVIFVIDASDRFRLVAVKEELELILKNSSLSQAAPLLIFANKMDIHGALTVPEIVQKLGLREMTTGRSFQIIASVATSGQGLSEGIDWLSAQLKE